ncbi:MAG TPA: nucleoside 2-deoxyribosyltransferase [Methanotrichaceae archaeon]|nr:nucleoside 2-deoxyribosyltransferase [Methanotrichaceae archaeon]
MAEKVYVYLAGPLFSRAEIKWAGSLKKEIESSLGDRIEVVWPHEIATRTKEEIFKTNLAALRRSSLMVAILDGPQVDDGTAWEVGCHHALFGPKAIGIRTDFRKAGETPESKVNLMIEQSCRVVVSDVVGLVQELEDALKYI